MSECVMFVELQKLLWSVQEESWQKDMWGFFYFTRQPTRARRVPAVPWTNQQTKKVLLLARVAFKCYRKYQSQKQQTLDPFEQEFPPPLPLDIACNWVTMVPAVLQSYIKNYLMGCFALNNYWGNYIKK